MPESSVAIGGRAFKVSAEAGQERSVAEAAAVLDGHARTILAEAGGIPDFRLLLMAGLMAADELNECRRRLAELESPGADSGARGDASGEPAPKSPDGPNTVAERDGAEPRSAKEEMAERDSAPEDGASAEEDGDAGFAARLEATATLAESVASRLENG